MLDEAHTLEDVAGQHFGLKVSEAGIRYALRTLYDGRRSKGMLSTHGAIANDAIRAVLDLEVLADRFFDLCIEWYEQHGKGNGRFQQKNLIPNDVSPKLRDLSVYLRAMLVGNTNEAEVTELTSKAERISMLGESLDAIMTQGMDDSVYWMEVSGRSPRRVTLHGAPINVGRGLQMHLFDKVKSVIMASATLCTSDKFTSTIRRAAPLIRPNPSQSAVPIKPPGSFVPSVDDVNDEINSDLDEASYMHSMSQADENGEPATSLAGASDEQSPANVEIRPIERAKSSSDASRQQPLSKITPLLLRILNRGWVFSRISICSWVRRLIMRIRRRFIWKLRCPSLTTRNISCRRPARRF